MKKLKIILCVSLVSLLALSAATVGVLAMNNRLWFQVEEKTDAYVFPVYEGEEAQGYDDIVKFLQIPEDVLKNMSTEGLIETCLSYPLFATSMYSNNTSPYVGFKKAIKEFNGLNELVKREDSGKKLLEVYRSVDIDEAVKSSDLYILRMRYLDYLISDEAILKTLSKKERSDLKELCIENIILKNEKYPNEFPLDSAILPIVNIDNIDNVKVKNYISSNEDIKEFIEIGRLALLENEQINDLLKVLDIPVEVK